MPIIETLNDGYDNDDSLTGWLSADYARRRFRRWQILVIPLGEVLQSIDNPNCSLFLQLIILSTWKLEWDYSS